MLEKLSTENRNTKTMNLDEMSTIDILSIMNEEDASVPVAIKQQLKNIEALIELTIESFNKGGRLIYIGAGTSGRLGVLDAAECPPTFGTDPSMVVGLIAGGEKAFLAAIEGAEDSKELAEAELKELNLHSNDMVIGIAASGRTPYVIGGLEYAKLVGASTGSIACNTGAAISQYSQVAVEINTGSEILTGSTRLKAGTAQKLVLNMISTASMIGIGKVYKNLMVDVQPTNEKLVERSIRIIMDASEADYETAKHFYGQADKDVKSAIVMILTNCSLQEAKKKLALSKGFVRTAI
ncbi:N-acetylmuramic acid 6-phosphate etherase [Bacillus sp. 1P06AnD]|uniref:N-acetylmuramic acid 6-phosphate etherase n=1 Tax=Bacillus sp. 1P06AnD TaxID=3132208 RepID=UPI0039A1D421